MKHAILFFAMGLLFSIVTIHAQVPNKISYQGLLTTSAGTPVSDGSYNLTFDLFNVSSGGSSLWTETQTGILLQQGTFSVMLGSITPLDALFNKSLYVEVTAVSGPGISSPITFSPRSELSSSPSSFTLVGPSCIATGDYAIAGGRHNRTRGNYAVVGGGGGAAESDSNSASGDYSTISGGRENEASNSYSSIGGGMSHTSSGFASTVGGGYQNTANAPDATVSGGAVNEATASYATVGGGYNNYARGEFSVIAGGSWNEVTTNRSTISGGYLNQVSGDYGTVGGGTYNKARGQYAVVSGGGGATEADSNSALGDYSVVNGGRQNKSSGTYGSVGGGWLNTASAEGSSIGGGVLNQAQTYGASIGGGLGNNASGTDAAIGAGNYNVASGDITVVGGGSFNEASGDHAVIGGGGYVRARGSYSVVSGGGGGSVTDSNSATGNYSTIPGGRANKASGAYSFAAGRRAKAIHDGAFVWGDGTDADVSSDVTDQFKVRASNGVNLAVNAGYLKTITMGDHYRDNSIVAWGRVEGATGVISSNEYGVTSAVRNSAGNYTITVDITAGGVAYLVPVAVADVNAPPTAAASARLVTIDQVSTNSFNVYITNGLWAATDNNFVFIVTAR